MKTILKTAFGIVFLLIGVALLFYPQFSELLLERQTEQYIEEFNAEYYPDTEDETDSDSSSGGDATSPNRQTDAAVKETDPLYQEILAYNTSIYESGQADFKDAWSYVSSPIDISGLEDGRFGYIKIPSMDVELPLYLGASSDNMAKGAAVLGQTSVPIGGINTNSVIAGHRGWYTGAFFKYIERIEIGDHVFITNPWETLAYEVESIDIVSPYASDKVKIQEGRDMVTLITCHPYLSHGNKYRYLVYCVRDEDYDFSDYDADAESEGNSSPDTDSSITASDGNTYESSEELLQKEALVQKIGAGIIIFILAAAIIRAIRNRNKTERRF